MVVQSLHREQRMSKAEGLAQASQQISGRNEINNMNP